MPRIKRLMTEVPSYMLTSKLRLMPNQARTNMAPKGTWKSILLSVDRGCYMAFRRLDIFPRWMGWFHSEGVSDLLSKLSLAPVLEEA